MGGVNGLVPAQEGRREYFGVPVQTVSHVGESQFQNAKQIAIPFPVDEVCVNEMIRPGQSLGTFTPSNNCQTFALDVLNRCRIVPSLGRPARWMSGAINR
jgi:hypothetical protein